MYHKTKRTLSFTSQQDYIFHDGGHQITQRAFYKPHNPRHYAPTVLNYHSRQ